MEDKTIADLPHIIGSRPASRSPSMITISSTNSFQETENRSRSGSTTASNSDLDEALSRFHPSPVFSTNNENVIVVNADNNPALASSSRVAISNSTEVQVATNIYNGPVTIKQFLLDNKHNKSIDEPVSETAPNGNGVLNEGFEEHAVNDDAKDKITENCDIIKNLTFSRRSALVTLVTLLFSIVAVAALLLFLKYSDQPRHPYEPSNNSTESTTTDSDLRTGKDSWMVSREQWFAQPPENKLTNLDLPVSRVIISHTVTPSCESQDACALRVRSMQADHMSKPNIDDIGYNFMIGGDGNVYEGRGWEKRGAHTKGFNTGSIGIAYIGTFSKKLPNEAQLNAGFLLLQEGVNLKKLTPDYKIYAHRQFYATESPGAVFFELIKKWPHWSQESFD